MDPAVGHRHILGVDDVDGHARAGITIQPRCGIDIQGSSHDQHDVRPHDKVDRFPDARHSLSEKYNVRPKLAAVRCLVPEVDFTVADVENLFLGKPVLIVEAVFGPDLGHLPVQMEHPGAACPFVQIVHVLGDHRYIVVLLEIRDGEVRGIRPYFLQLFASYVVEIEDEFPIPIPSVDGCYIVGVVLVPKSAVVSECLDAAFRAHACAGEDDDFLLAHITCYLK